MPNQQARFTNEYGGILSLMTTSTTMRERAGRLVGERISETSRVIGDRQTGEGKAH